MWIHYQRLHNHNKAKHNKTVCIFLAIYCRCYVVSTNHSILCIDVTIVVPVTILAESASPDGVFGRHAFYNQYFGNVCNISNTWIVGLETV